MSSRSAQTRLRRTLERVGSEPGLGKNVAASIALVLLAVVVGSVILVNQRFEVPWAHKLTFTATFEDTPGVSPGHGQEVRIAGVQVGTIDGLGVDSNGDAAVTMSIDPAYRVYSNATVVLRPKSPLNEMYVELNPGTPAGRPLHDGDVLSVNNSRRPVQIDEVLDHLDASSREALGSLLSESDIALARATTDLPAGLQATDALARQLAPVMSALQTRRAAIARLVTQFQEISTAVGGDDARLTHLADALQTTLGAFVGARSAVDSTLSQLPGLADQLNHATASVQTLTARLNPALRHLQEASGSLPPALQKLSETVDRLGQTTDKLGPVLAKAAPVVADLRPLVGGLRASAPAMVFNATRLDPVTSNLVKYLPDLSAFVIQTNSVSALHDTNGGLMRGLLYLSKEGLPTDALSALTGRQ